MTDSPELHDNQEGSEGTPQEESSHQPFVFQHDARVAAWDVQEGESARDYAYFDAYLRLGPNRTVMMLKRKIEEDRANGVNTFMGSSTVMLKHRMARFKWVERCNLYDRHQIQLARRQEEYKRQQMVRIDLQEYQKVSHQMARSMMSLTSKLLNNLHRTIDNSQDEEWNLTVLCRLLPAMNQTAVTSGSIWADSLGVKRLLTGLDAMESKLAADQEQG